MRVSLVDSTFCGQIQQLKQDSLFLQYINRLKPTVSWTLLCYTHKYTTEYTHTFKGKFSHLGFRQRRLRYALTQVTLRNSRETQTCWEKHTGPENTDTAARESWESWWTWKQSQCCCEVNTNWLCVVEDVLVWDQSSAEVYRLVCWVLAVVSVIYMADSFSGS